jgi:molybdopterin/thiamine biosynthesis adenylyltransferase
MNRQEAMTEEQQIRYRKNILLQEVGTDGQQKLMDARVLIMGTGGLGSPVSLYLAAAGIGHIGIVDADAVDVSNLQRQVIHFTKDVGRLKVESAKEKILAMNPNVEVTTYPFFLNTDNAQEIIQPWDFIIDATDNFQAKFLINDTCVMLDKPFSHGSILRFQGETFTHLPGTACYRCFFREQPADGSVPTANEVGVLGSVAGITGTIQATEVLKYLLGTGELLTDRLLTFDALTMNFHTIHIKKRNDCEICGHVHQ